MLFIQQFICGLCVSGHLIDELLPSSKNECADVFFLSLSRQKHNFSLLTMHQQMSAMSDMIHWGLYIRQHGNGNTTHMLCNVLFFFFSCTDSRQILIQKVLYVHRIYYISSLVESEVCIKLSHVPLKTEPCLFRVNSEAQFSSVCSCCPDPLSAEWLTEQWRDTLSLSGLQS